MRLDHLHTFTPSDAPVPCAGVVRRLTRAERADMRWREAMEHDAAMLAVPRTGQRAGVAPWPSGVAA